VSWNVFEEPAPGRFALNETAKELLDPGQRLGLDLEGIGGRCAHAWSTLLTVVRTGKPAYREIFGLPFWEGLAAHPEIAASFDLLMGPTGHGAPNPEFQITGGWTSVRTVVDVGGGTGALLAAILRARPEIRGILADLPRTVTRLRQDLPGGRRGRPRHGRWAELLRLPAGRRGPLSARRGVERPADREAQYPPCSNHLVRFW
jgi:2,7-dihydroxy-5-methyl-1-naphthoate 7-O-methyltransferase